MNVVSYFIYIFFIAEIQSGENINEICSSQVLEAPNGSKSWIPVVDESLKPVLKTCFDSLDHAISMYSNYAEAAGFDIRLTSKKVNKFGIVQIRYVVCSKSGVPKKTTFNPLEHSGRKKKIRNSNFKRCDCKAGVKFRLLKGVGKYELYDFVEEHSHPLLSSTDMCFSRKRRQLGFGDKMLVHRGNSLNLGASRVHKMRTTCKGGYDFCSSSTVDFQNFKRDMDKYVVDGGDAQMFINMMNNRKDVAPNFFFDYKVANSELVCTFWADEAARFNYSEFGDVMSFDATFRTNRYCMVFIPFTVVDNHKKSVIVGAALVNKEDGENYIWVLEAFLRAHGKAPLLVLTDQCLAMKQAIAAVFPNSRHRLCMWHIMDKLPKKFSTELLNGTSFRKEMNKIVWDVQLDPEEFEHKWNVLMEEYSLSGDKWLQALFNIRRSWIPAYFKHLPMCSLMKTTSRSESINSFFNSFSHYGNTLVFFVNCFDAALDKQRFTQRSLDHVTKSTFPKFLTPCKIERHASDIYTRAVFNVVQMEIYKATWNCSIENVESEGDVNSYKIAHKDKASNLKCHHKVVEDKKQSIIFCSCNSFIRCGLLCRHIFKVLLNTNVEKIPEKYILRRWRRDLIPRDLQHTRLRYGDLDEEQEKMFNEVLSTVENCLGRLRCHKEDLARFTESIRILKKEVDVSFPNENASSSKVNTIVDLIGVSQPDNVEVYPPTGIRNKGCGKGKRLVGAGEIASNKASRHKRLCRSCGKLVNHDSRNCPNKVT
ncbi:hypothetical protein OSB04_014894 [Centaurea solstitialis]|uniref:SWIM-type domain-containing protein n=1 Tax=Centaurea solstitialis TaxID=347529 RepID=A0AA38WI68_9ASTR|nr:hypothetical protein OSB04_014894 [Centaurea solstitialis]